jgi:uncharacterized protein with LGFP repeats
VKKPLIRQALVPLIAAAAIVLGAPLAAAEPTPDPTTETSPIEIRTTPDATPSSGESEPAADQPSPSTVEETAPPSVVPAEPEATEEADAGQTPADPEPSPEATATTTAPEAAETSTTPTPMPSETPEATPSPTPTTDGRVIAEAPPSALTANGSAIAEFAVPAAERESLAVPGATTLAQGATSASTFTLTALTWQSATPGITLYARFFQDGAWGEWMEFVSTDDAALESGSFHGTEAGWVGASTGIDIEAVGPAGSTITGLTARLISTTEDAVAPTVRKSGRSLAGGYVAQPAIVFRGSWGAAPSPDCEGPDESVRAAVVHHTVGTNNYTRAQAPGIVRGVQAYHQSLGWCDVGYNFLVDIYGTIYEGRTGGIALPVHGAHALDWNEDTVGVSAMMNAATAQPSAALIESMSQIIAWKLGNNYRDPLGWVTLVGERLPVIFGHRDVLNTACPGQYLYARMTDIRERVAAIINASGTSPIHELWLELGGESSYLGEPYWLESPHAGGRGTQFTNGWIYWSAATGTHPVHGAIVNRYQSLGGPDGYLGFPTSDEIEAPGGGVYQTFQGGAIYWSQATDAQAIHGAARILYERTDGPESFLGYPTSGEVPQTGGGIVQFFEGGRIYWSEATDAHRTGGRINAVYSSPEYDGPASYLGYPITEEIALEDPEGVYQDFQGGRFYWSDASGAWPVHGAIGGSYARSGGPESALGYPTGAETADVNGGVHQTFQNGRYYWSEKTDAYPVHGAIGGLYVRSGGAAKFGYPISTEAARQGGGVTQRFERAVFAWTEEKDAWIVSQS